MTDDPSETDHQQNKRRADRLATILDHAPVMIDEFGAEGRCVLWNQACQKHLGYTQEEVNAAEDPLSLFYPDPIERDRVVQSIERADGEFREYRVQAKDGAERRQVWADLRLPDGAKVSVGHDVTEQRLVEEQLRRSQKLEAVGQFAAGMAHDFSNLLTVVLANADLIRTLDGLPAEVLTSVSEIAHSAERGAALIRKLLAFTRRGVLTIATVDLSAVVADMATTVTRLVPDTVRVRVQTEASLPPIQADAGAIEQMLLNLTTNARDAMRRGGMMTVVVEQRWLAADAASRLELDEGAYAVLSVLDEGEGIAPEAADRVFEPFFSTKEEHGTGLGLSIVRGLMAQHGGAVQIESDVGRGTAVTLYFPLHPAVRLASDAPRATSSPPAKKVLVVDDEASIRQVTCTALERNGFKASAAPDGEKALAHLQANPEIALVISDLVMPNMGGADLYRAALRLPRTPAFLFVTASALDDARKLLSDLDAPPIIRKPYRLDELLDAVKERLRSGEPPPS